MYFGLPADSMETTFEGFASNAPTEMETQVASLEPSKFLASKGSHQTAFRTTTPASGDDEVRGEPFANGMEIDNLPQEQTCHISATTYSAPKAQEQISLLQALKSMRDRLLATLGVKDLEIPPSSAAETLWVPSTPHGSPRTETGSGNDAQGGPGQGLAFSDQLDSRDRLWLSNDNSELRTWIDAHQVQYNNLTSNRNVLVDSLDQLTLEPRPSLSEDDQLDATLVDSESERGRSRKRQRAPERQKAKGPRPLRRRLVSPEWNVVLGEPDPSFVPDHSYFCSRCLRRVPEANRRHNAKQASAVENEYKFHIAQDRSCRIRNGLGSVHNLPNRSGWIPVGEMPNLDLLKSRFLDAHPAYAATLYPVLPSDARNLWRSDPNNVSNSPHWDLPWPPYMDHLPPVPEGSEKGPAARSKFAAVKSAKKRVGSDADAGYCYETDTESERPSADEVDVMPRRRKRRRLGDASYRPRGASGGASDSDDELAGGAPPERLRYEMEQEIRSIARA